MYLQITVLGLNSFLAADLSRSQNHRIISVVGCGSSWAVAWQWQANFLAAEKQGPEWGTIHLDPVSLELPKLEAHITSV
jgi:hypothetical protein